MNHPVKMSKQEFLNKLKAFEIYWESIDSIPAKNYAGVARCVMRHFVDCDNNSPFDSQEQRDFNWVAYYDNVCDLYLKYAADCHKKSPGGRLQTREDHIYTAEGFMAVRAILTDN